MRLSDIVPRPYSLSATVGMISTLVVLAIGVTGSALHGQEPAASSPAAEQGAARDAERAGAPDGAAEPDVVTEPVPAAEQEGAPATGRAMSDEASGLRFNFSATPWRDVLEWLAEEADLSLRAERFPPATLTFIDPSRTYSPAEALDQLNRLLLDRGFALVRRGRLLIVIDLEDPAAEKYIENIAEVVAPPELDERGESDIVKVIFPLGAMTAEAAEEELAQMVGPGMPMTVLPSARQVVVTDTVARLKAIRSVLEDAEEAGSEVVEIPLKHRGAEEVLMLARPLLQLEDGENANDQIRIAIDPFGERLYAVGNSGLISLLKRIVEKADQPLESDDGGETVEARPAELRSYPITVADPTTVYDVLQTLLAGLPDTRLTIDPETNSIIAFARPETHKTIQATLDQLEGKGKQLEVIQLRRLEPSAALLTINKFFGKTETGNEGPTVDGDPITGRLWVHGTPEEITKTKNLIEQLEGADTAGPLGNRVRILPFSGQNATETLEQVRMLWEVSGRNTQIRVVTPSRTSAHRGGLPERSLSSRQQRLNEGTEQPAERGDVEEREAASRSRSSDADGDAEVQPLSDRSFPEASHQTSNPFFRFAAQQFPAAGSGADGQAAASDNAGRDQNALDQNGRGAPPAAAEGAEEAQDRSSDQQRSEGRGEIVISMTPQGMIVVGDDPVALAEFEELMRTVSEQTTQAGAPPTVFWLKYVKASAASQLINGILGGGESSGGGLSDAAGGLLGELGGGMLGGLMGLGGGGDSSSGPILTSTGSVSIIPDDRLNALIIQANPLDMQMIEQILQVIDREESPEDVQTQAKPRLIPVIYQDAQAVAEIVKSVFADKMAGQNSGRGGGRGGDNDRPSPQEFLEALRGGGRGGRGGGDGAGEKSEPQKITVAVDKRSNALIVTATPQDYDEIRDLVEAIDQGGMENEETVQVVQLNGAINPQVVQNALSSVLGGQAQTSSSSTSQNTSSESSSRSSSDNNGGDRSNNDASEIQRRIEMFRAMRERGGGGGGRGGFGGGRGGFGGRGGGDRGGGGGR